MDLQDFKFGSFEFEEDSSDSLQRTEKWLQERSGKWTGSVNKKLMATGRASAKKSWLEDKNKVFDFGAGVESHIYAIGKERITGFRSMEIHAKQMNHGKENEPLLIQKLIDDGIIENFEEKGFEHFPDYEFGGASVDGICTIGPGKPKTLKGVEIGEEVALELKCCVSWAGHFARMYEPIHEKHDDFWQFQSEMLASRKKKLLYVVAYPMTIEKYDLQICNASEYHQEMLVKRCKIADQAIKYWDEESYPEALARAISEFKE